MLITTLYHRIGEGKYSNPLSMLISHLQYIKDHFPIVLPGDPLQSFSRAVCLTFDDATFDFYYYVFPLLQRLNVRVLLAVPVQYILEKSTLSPKERLSVPYAVAMQDGIYEHKTPFCTWEELREMVQSGLVEVASHSYSHANLTYPHLDLTQEIEIPKKILEAKLSQEISSFVYPFGKVNGHLHQKVQKHYPYAFRIGSSVNWSWDCGLKPLSRIPADNLVSPKAPFRPLKFMKTLLKSFI